MLPLSFHPSAARDDIYGRCHCGNLSFFLRWPAAMRLILRVCACDFCTRHGALWLSHPAAPVTLNCADQDAIVAYRFASESADFLLCRRCGIVTMARCVVADGQRVVVNANTFENIAVAHCQRAAAHLGDEGLPARVACRLRNWSPLIAQLA